MKAKHSRLRVLFALLLACTTTMTIGCGDLVSQSLRDGLFNYVIGSVSSGFDAALFGDFITSVFTGGFGGTTGGGRND